VSNFISALYLIASIFEICDGVERDLRLARYWYDATAKYGAEAVPEKMKEPEAKTGAWAG
jgi:hypothetical protein